MNQLSAISEVSTAIVSDDEEISTQPRALIINTCESSHYLGQLQAADTKQSITGVQKNDPPDTKEGMKNGMECEEVRADGL